MADTKDAPRPNVGRRPTADQVPLFLRAWWLKDYEEAPEVMFAQGPTLTTPLFSLQTDPYCDAGSIDVEIP